MITTEILIIFLLLLVNAFFALSEMAVVSASKPMLRQLARQGNRRAAAALELAENSGRFLSTVQIGITLVGTLAGAYGGATIADKVAGPFNEISFIQPHGDTLALALVVSIITYFSVVIGELVPKQFALSNAENIAMFVARPMLLIDRAFSPVVRLLNGSAQVLMKVLGVFKRVDEGVTVDELKAVIAEGVESGAIEQSENQMLQRIIRLGDRDIKSVMTHRMDVTFLDIDDSLETIRRKVHEAGHSRYPVTDGDVYRVIGVVQAKELLDAALSSNDIRIRDHLKEVTILPENINCMQALEMFKSANIHLAVIVDEYGATLGMITASDLMEAIVGALPSNYDEADEALIVQRADGSWLVDGMTPIDEIHLTIGLEDIHADGSFDTIAGFLLQAANKTLTTGEVLERFGHRFEVLDMDGRRIDKILITRLAEPVYSFEK